MEFYALPIELIGWLESLLLDETNWILRWEIRPNIFTQVSRGSKSDPKTKWSIGAGPGPHFFIGNARLCAKPIMIRRDDGLDEIDFLGSLCVRLVPGFINQSVLLEGRLESFPNPKYRKLPGGKSFLAWKAELLSSFKEAIFKMPTAATQLLQDGSTKRWNNVLVSQEAIDWFVQGGKLKQFPTGPVEITPILLSYS